MEDHGDYKTVFTDDGQQRDARAVIIAAGVKHRMLGLPGENELVGEGISFCAVCDGDFYSGQTVCVAGGGNSALQEAILLAGKCAKVIMLQDLPEFTGEKKLQDILFSRPNVEKKTGVKITALNTEAGALRSVTVEPQDGGAAEQVACDGLFVAIGLIPENGAFAELADLNPGTRGYAVPVYRRCDGSFRGGPAAVRERETAGDPVRPGRGRGRGLPGDLRCRAEGG